MNKAEEMAYQYCQETPAWGQIAVRYGRKGILFTGPDSPPDGEFIPLDDLGYNAEIGFFRRSQFPRERSV